MIRGNRIVLRPICEEDWSSFEKWAENRDALWGPFQRYQLDHLPQLRDAYRQNGLLSRQSAFLMIEKIADQKVIGFIRYTLLTFPDVDIPYPEIGFGIAEIDDRKKGYAHEAIELLVGYLFDGYPCERLAAFIDVENIPSQRVLQKSGFQREGVLRRAGFRDGRWRDVAVYSLIRQEYVQKGVNE